MPNAENSPGQPTPPLPEPVPFPAVVQNEHHTVKMRTDDKDTLYVQVEHAETVIFSAAVTREQKVRILFEAAPGTPEPVAVALSQETPVGQEQREKDIPVRLHGRIGTDMISQTSPTDGTMVVFSLAEHPLVDEDCFWNTLPEDQRPQLKNKTAWWRVAAFDERIKLLDGAKKGEEYSVTAYRRTWKEATGTSGKTKTIEGFYLLDIEPAAPKSKKHQEAQQKTLLE